MTSAKLDKRGLGTFLQGQKWNRRIGIIITTIISLMIILLSLPFVNWINITNLDVLSSSLKIKEADMGALSAGYSLLNILKFVEISKQGALGLSAMLLFLLSAGAILLHVIVVFRGITEHYGKNGLLTYYVFAKSSIILSVIVCIGTIVFSQYANLVFKMPGFSLTLFPFLVLLFAVVSYILTKIMERMERIKQREHGFMEELRRNWILFVFLIPCAVYLLINNYLPMIGIYFAFTKFNFREGLFASPYIGFKNFEFLFDGVLLRLTRNTLLYNIVFIGLGNITQLMLAILVSRTAKKWFKKTTQTMIFMPFFVSFVIFKVLVYNLFEYQFGLINTYVTTWGGERIDFYNTPAYWPLFIVLFHLWKSVGYGMVVYISAITSISDDFYDAAKVDGASTVQQIRHITLPLLKPTFIILLLYSLGGIMRGQFELFYQMIGDNGVLFGVTDIIDTFVFRSTRSTVNIGLGAAAGLYQSIFGFTIVVVTNFWIKRKNADYALF